MIQRHPNASVLEQKVDCNWKHALAILVLVQLALGMIYLKTVPRFYNDEAWEASLGYNVANEGSLRHGIIEGWGGMHIHFVQNQVVMPFVLAAIYKIAGFGIAESRAGSVLMSVLAVVSTYFVTRKLFGGRQAFVTGLMLTLYPWFFEVSRRVRPEIYYIAIGMTALWCLLEAIETNSKSKMVWAGILAALAALTHPTGLVLVGTIFVAAMSWFGSRGKQLRLVVATAGGFFIAIVPYIIYVLWAVQNPEVSFIEQMQGGSPVVKTMVRSITAEIKRWAAFLQWPKGIPYALMLAGGLGLAWYKSGRAEKFVATVIVLFAVAMPFTTVNATGRYLVALTPFVCVLMVQMIFRVVGGKLYFRAKRLRWVVGMSIGAVYAAISLTAIAVLVYKLHNADFGKVIDRIASVTGSKSKIYGEMVFWMGRDKLNYGPFPLDYKWEQSMEMVEQQRFDYAVRCGVVFSSSGGISQPPQTMPPFGKNTIDKVCQTYGTLVDSFRDPYFGPMEIYRLDRHKDSQ